MIRSKPFQICYLMRKANHIYVTLSDDFLLLVPKNRFHFPVIGSAFTENLKSNPTTPVFEAIFHAFLLSYSKINSWTEQTSEAAFPQPHAQSNTVLFIPTDIPLAQILFSGIQWLNLLNCKKIFPYWVIQLLTRNGR